MRKYKFLISFLCELPLILRDCRKRRNVLEIFARYIEFERDWPVFTRWTVNLKKKYFSSFMDFFGKTYSIILLGVDSTINLIKIIDAIFEKTGIFIFLFLCELPLILGVGEN